MTPDRVAEALAVLEAAVHPEPLYGDFIRRDGLHYDKYQPKPDADLVLRAAPALLKLARVHQNECWANCVLLAELAATVLGPVAP